MRLPSVSSARPRIFAALIIVAAAVISFESLKHLAEYAGFGQLSWLFPVTLDAVAAFGMDLWITRSPAWRKARALALAAILGSLTGNIADHWISQGTILPAVLGAVPPGALAWLLAVLHSHGAGTAAHRSGPDPAVRDAVWSSLPQGSRYRTVATGPSAYMVPVRIWSLDRSAPFEGPAVGPMVRNHGPRPVRSERVRVHAVREDREVGPVRQASSAPRAIRSGGPTDDVLVKAIHDQYQLTGVWPSKRLVMHDHEVGSGRALRLLALAKETEVS